MPDLLIGYSSTVKTGCVTDAALSNKNGAELLENRAENVSLLEGMVEDIPSDKRTRPNSSNLFRPWAV